MESNGQDQNGTIIFDTTSGISLEEQKLILDEINTMAGIGNRIAPDVPVTEAKKKGFIFPLCVNAGAIILLVLGFLILINLHNQQEQSIRESASPPGITEQLLILEIRLENHRLLSELEAQINEISIRLSEVDSEYRLLLSSVVTLTDADQERAMHLLAMQEDYRLALAELHEERAKLLAAEELMAMSSEQDQVNRAEDQMSGFYGILNTQITEGLYEEALNTINAMRDFLASPFLGQLKSFDHRRQAHLSVILGLEETVGFLLGDLVIGTSATADDLLSDLIARNAALEQDLAAFNAQGSDQNRIISEYRAALSQLETETVNQQTLLDSLTAAVDERDQSIALLNNTIAANSEEMDELRRQNTELQAQIEAIRVLLSD